LEDVEGPDGTSQYRGVGYVWEQALVCEEPACLAGFGFAVLRKIDVPPPCEAVFKVPGALTMTN
jgi:hypothetical protein